MSTVIDGLRFLAHRAENTPRNSDGVVDLDELVLAEMHRLQGLGSLALKLTGIRAARIYGSERDVTRMLRNVGENAYEHARHKVAIELSVTDTTAEIRVTNDGHGIPAGDRDRIFQRFTRLDESRRRSAAGGGAGLGLAIARQITLDHHGNVTALHRADEKPGAVFLVTLPLAQPSHGTRPHGT